ncbi:MAG: PfkB family carbohydrate kinase [Nitrososphaera sp.]|jgi:sugar/nucleoside kinase (ribokinase family)
MKLGIFSHCTIDEIKIGEGVYETPGGPACYCGMAARNMGFEVELATKFGKDFTFTEQLQKNKIVFENTPSGKPTTRFRLEINDTDRTLWLKNICDEIDYKKINADGILVSPVFNEISYPIFEKIKNDSEMVFLDPQGFLRRMDTNKKIYYERTEINLSKITGLKSDPSEVYNLTGLEGINGVLVLQKKVKYVLYTNKQDVSLFYNDKRYSIRLPNMDVYDTSGVGDIFTATFCCTLLKEKDVLWALSFAGGAAQAALESKEIGLNKVPPKAATETNAGYFYNTIKFTDV